MWDKNSVQNQLEDQKYRHEENKQRYSIQVLYGVEWAVANIFEVAVKWIYVIQLENLIEEVR